VKDPLWTPGDFKGVPICGKVLALVREMTDPAEPTTIG